MSTYTGPSHVFIVMGVSGSGKSTIAEEMAKQMGWPYYDADNFHSDSNKEKMKHGIPLNDEDRDPWLHKMHHAISEWISDNENAVLACSALKKTYRDILSAKLSQRVWFIYLKGSKELIKERIMKRTGHYMNPILLDSQFDTLEEPDKNDSEAPRTLTVGIEGTVQEIVKQCIDHVKERLAKHGQTPESAAAASASISPRNTSA
eukprot:TRINITY_DN2314_c0_g1_i1.p1 TRINITY_DN2314_c0_g1~~TRINITY_DN2314_c0_g1_i1.p1  ORF type:complete len:204 (-),score=58.53 TRINITY_DN2314_c0_g1_i1:70-681(-)